MPIAYEFLSRERDKHGDVINKSYWIQLNWFYRMVVLVIGSKVKNHNGFGDYSLIRWFLLLKKYLAYLQEAFARHP